MASACLLHWIPDSLYNSSVSTVVIHYSKFRQEIKTLPENVQFDIYYKLYNKDRLCELAMELSSLDVFSRVLRIVDKRALLHHCFQAVMDHGTKLSVTLADAFRHRCSLLLSAAGGWKEKDKVIQLGFSLGGFLIDAGWLVDSESIHLSCLDICRTADHVNAWQQAVHCCARLMHIRNCNCMYNEAEATWNVAMTYVDKLAEHGIHINRASLCSEYSTLLFARSSYDDSYKMCCSALNELSSLLYPRIIVDVFRQAVKVCVVRREFKRAEVLIKFAVHYAREHFGAKHQVFSDAILDYGFFLLNVDLICQSVKVYQMALDIRMSVFGGNNLHVAIAHEDLAYCSYVHEYSSGKFQDAKHHADVAIDIITRILPHNHLLLASSKRVKALILEEIAIDSHNKTVEEKLLSEARELHLSSLMLAKQAFGENNVQTAKHYGNLGRLFQSMHKYQDAEEMHLKAIAIKEQLLGTDDYEVALSVGHLASLYNYDMQKYEEAEQLYIRSIAIGKQLFGNGYSGLEYDYRGLLRLYQSRGDAEKAAEYATILHEWNHLRDRKHNESEVSLEFEVSETCEAAVEEFFRLPGRGCL